MESTAAQAFPVAGNPSDEQLMDRYLRRRQEVGVQPAATVPPLGGANTPRRQTQNKPRPGLLRAGEAQPAPFTCPECGDICMYALIGESKFAWRRVQCHCEKSSENARIDAHGANPGPEEREAALRSLVGINRRNSGFYGELWEKTFEAFDTARADEMAEVYEELLAWVAGFNRKATRSGFILSSTGYGCGKTHLVTAAGLELLSRGFSVCFFTIPNFLQALRDEYAGNSERGATRARALKSDALILDDLGLGRIAKGDAGDWAREQLTTLLDARMNYGRPLLGTSNLSLSQIAQWVGGDSDGGRVASRLRAMAQWREVDGPDGRIS